MTRISRLVVASALPMVVAAGARAGDEKPAAAASPAPAVTITGFAQVDYRRGRTDVATAVAHEVGLRRARLQFSGRVASRVTYGLTLQGDGLNANSGSLLDAWVDVGVSPLARVRAGQFKYEFDVEGREPAPSLPFLDRPFVTNAVAGSLDGASTASAPAAAFRDRGLMLHGEGRVRGISWGHALGLYQGAGRGSDNNNSVAVVANAFVRPLKGLRVGGGLLSSNARAQGTRGSHDYRAWTAGASYETERLMVRGELYRAVHDRGPARDGLGGYYLTGAWGATRRLDLLLRYQSLRDEQHGPGGEDARSVDLGARWYIVRAGRRGGTHVSANYAGRSAEPGFARGFTLLGDGRGAALPDGQSVRGVFVVRMQVQF